MTEYEFDQLHIAKLNDQQKAAVKTVDGPVLLLAVPGSGKTTVIVKRLGYMLLVKGISPENILTVTYTVAATREMRERFREEFGAEPARALEFRTINSFAQNVIDYYGRTCSRRQPFAIESDDGRLAGIVRGIYVSLNKEYPDDSTVRDVRTAVTYVKNMMLTTEEIGKLDNGIAQFPEIFRLYNKALRDAGKMDYDDQLAYAYSILRTRPTVLEYFQSRFVYLNVDEAQDTSRIQHAIIRLLADRYRNLFMVGDEDQSIYGFRAAYPEALIGFSENYPGAKVLYLEENFRSTPEIVALANSFISGNTGRYRKRAAAVRPSGAVPEKIPLSKRNAQYAFICDLAEKADRETAFLYRNNDSAVPIIDLFERRGIRYNCRNFDDTFFTNRLIKDIEDIFSFACEEDPEVFLRIYYKLGVGITKEAALSAVAESRLTAEPILRILSRSEALKQYARDNVPKLNLNFRLLPKDPADLALSRIWDQMGYGSYAAKMGLDKNKYEILCVLAKALPGIKSRENAPDLRALFDRMNELREGISVHVNDPDNDIVLSTVHSSKGLEYDSVYLVDMYNGILPALSGTELTDEEKKAQYQEDRRIFYVAVTRAKNALHVLDCGKNADFIGELFPERQMTYGEAVRSGKSFPEKRLPGEGYEMKNGLFFPKKDRKKK